MPRRNGLASVRGGRHLVHFYSDELDLAETVEGYVADTLHEGGVAVAAASPNHLRALEAELRRVGIDLAAAREGGSYFTFDAKAVARDVMAHGTPDDARVHVELNETIELITASGRPLFLYVELGPLLWKAGMIDTAFHAETCANKFIAEDDVTILCAYSMRSIADETNPEAVRQLCHHHTYLTSLPFTA